MANNVRIILADKGKKLVFTKDNMILEIDKNINLNSFTDFMMEVFIELIIAKYNHNKKNKGKKLTSEFRNELMNKIVRID